MAYIDWKEIYETGLEIIDHQHKNIIEYLNELHYAQTNVTDEYFVNESLQKLEDYTRYHFTTVENLYEKHGYSVDDNHFIKQDYFFEQIEILKENIEKNNLLSSLRTIAFLKHWTINHILAIEHELAFSFKAKVNSNTDCLTV